MVADLERVEASLLDKIAKGEKLSETECRLMNEFAIEKKVIQKFKGYQDVESIVQLRDDYFKLFWSESLNEAGENYFIHQPKKVRKFTVLKEINEYIDV